MKAKNLVSLAVATVFIVLSITGVLIYMGQSNHFVDHTHAWFGMLFVGAASFHIVNNWSSIKSYSLSRKTGRIQRELILPSIVVLSFIAGIAPIGPSLKILLTPVKMPFGLRSQTKKP